MSIADKSDLIEANASAGEIVAVIGHTTFGFSFSMSVYTLISWLCTRLLASIMLMFDKGLGSDTKIAREQGSKMTTWNDASLVYPSTEAVIVMVLDE